MNAWIITINEWSKRPECELGDIIGVYGFEPTATEREVFDCYEVTNVPVEEIQEELEEGFDCEKEYPKFKTNLKCLSDEERAELADTKVKKTATMAIIRKIEKKNHSEKPKKKVK